MTEPCMSDRFRAWAYGAGKPFFDLAASALELSSQQMSVLHNVASAAYVEGFLDGYKAGGDCAIMALRKSLGTPGGITVRCASAITEADKEAQVNS